MHIVSPGVGLHQGEKIRRRGWWGLGASALTAFLSWSLMIPLDSFGLFGLSFVAGITGLVSTLMIWGGARSAAARAPGQVTVTETELIVQGPRVARIALDDIVDGWVAYPYDVHLRTEDGRTLVVDARDPETAQALLAKAGVGPHQRVLTVPLSSQASVVTGGVPAAMMGITALTPLALFLGTVLSIGIQDVVTAPSGGDVVIAAVFFWMLLALLVAIGLMVTTLRRREAVVGVDGITIRSAMRKTFVPHTAITQVSPHPKGVEILLRDGSTVLLHTWRRGEPTIQLSALPYRDAAVRQRALLDRIAQAARATHPAPDAKALDRGERSIEAWREHVLSLLRRGGYREELFHAHDLAAVLEDPTAPPERRVAAAMGLAESDEPADAKRLRVVIDTCADEELRAALEHAAAAEHDELERATSRLRRS